MAIYRANDEYRRTPNTLLAPIDVDNPEGGRMWVGIGGSVTITRNPPQLDEVIPEATAEQYRYLYHHGLSSMIKRTEEKKKNEPAPPKSNS